MREENWLKDMIDASLEDPAGERRVPDFAFLKEQAAGVRFRNRRTTARYIVIPAAAAVLAAALAAPLGIRAGRRSEERRINREIQELFVEGLIGDSLFDEGLVSGDEWFSDIGPEDDFFEI